MADAIVLFSFVEQQSPAGSYWVHIYLNLLHFFPQIAINHSLFQPELLYLIVELNRDMWNLSENFKWRVSAIQKFNHPIEITASWKSTKYSFYCFIRSVVKNTPQVKTNDTFKDILRNRSPDWTQSTSELCSANYVRVYLWVLSLNII